MQHLLKTLICNNCKNYLNIIPLVSFLDGKTICGRCYDPAKYENVPSNEKPTQNIALESVIQLFPFPCIYHDKGCRLKNVSKNYLNHEASCSFRPFKCPVEACTWTGVLIDLKEHFENEHRNNLAATSTVTLNISDESIFNCIMQNETHTTMFQSKFDAANNKYYCDCVLLSKLQYHDACVYNMELEFKIHNNPADSTISFKKPISNTIELIDENKALQIDVQVLKTLTNTDCLEANVKIYPVGDEIHKSSDSNLLNELKCPVCLNLFIPRVFLCSNGHSICEACKNQLVENSCPICKISYESIIHNITLEKLIRVMIYPCKYHISGCSFAAPSTRIGEHENICEYSI